MAQDHYPAEGAESVEEQTNNGEAAAVASPAPDGSAQSDYGGYTAEQGAEYLSNAAGPSHPAAGQSGSNAVVPYDNQDGPNGQYLSPGKRPRASRYDASPERGRAPSPRSDKPRNRVHDWQKEVLMAIFEDENSSNTSHILHLLTSNGMTIDYLLDQEAHSAIHWAAALGRIKIVKMLLKHGADVKLLNLNGETALMRAVLVVNNYESQTYPKLIELLRDIVFYADNDGRTVLHHIARTSGNNESKRLITASKYYMKHTAQWLQSNSGIIPTFIDFEDKNGDTALNIACRNRNASVAESLLGLGAKTDTPNHAGKRPTDYAQLDAKLAALFGLPAAVGAFVVDEDDEDEKEPLSLLNGALAQGGERGVLALGGAGAGSGAPGDDARVGKVIGTVHDLVKSLSTSFQNELNHRDRKFQLIQENIQAAAQHLEDARRTFTELTEKEAKMREDKATAERLEAELMRVLTTVGQPLKTGAPAPSSTEAPASADAVREDGMAIDGEAPAGPMADAPSGKKVDLAPESMPVDHPPPYAEAAGAHPEGELSDLGKLKAQLLLVNERKAYLVSRIAAYEQQQASREAKLKEIIAKATGFPPENMDDAMLKALLDELQAD
ncbi:ankyrin repeat-containing domain protein [Hyaloraphidium curvatum]|nr:ankyrin repeat-containing domain protein [Hyaloraphidium curvatum]